VSPASTTSPDPVRARRRPHAVSPLHGGRFGMVAVVPFVVFMLMFAVYPLAQVVRMSLSDVQIQQGVFRWDFGTLANFARMFHDALAMSSAVTTAVFIVLTVPLTLVLGTLLAVLVDRSALFGPIARNLALWPAVVAPVVVSLIWLLILSPSIGSLNRLLIDLGLPPQGWLGSEAGAMLAIVLVDVWHWTPVVFLLVYTALKGIDDQILEAARVDGAGEQQIFWRVVLPLLTPALAAAALIRLVMGVKAFDEMYLLTRGGPGDATTLVSLHIRNVFFDRLELGYGAAFSLTVVLFVIVVLLISVAVRRTVRQGSAA
jgi:multiple sugar transport system permease protein